MDLYGPLPKGDSTDGRYLLVIVDYFTKWPEVLVIPDKTADAVARAFLQGFVAQHSLPQRIVTDNGAEFVEKVEKGIERMFALMGIRHNLCAAAHPQGNGVTERFNRYLGQSLYTVISASQKDWDTQLWQVLFAYCTSVHPTTAETPYYLLYGRDAILPEDILFAPPMLDEAIQRDDGDVARYLRDMIPSMQRNYALVAEQLRKFAEDKTARIAPTKKPSPVLEIGDLVMVSQTEAHRKGESTKFESCASGPFRVLSRVAEDTWRLLHTQTLFQWVVNVDRITPYRKWKGVAALQDSAAPMEVDPSGQDSAGEPTPSLPEEDMEAPTPEPGAAPPLTTASPPTTSTTGAPPIAATMPVRRSDPAWPTAKNKRNEDVPYDPRTEWFVRKIVKQKFHQRKWHWLVEWGGDWANTWLSEDKIPNSALDGTKRIVRLYNRDHPYARNEKHPTI
jgi:hypothetical protein